MKDRFPFDAYIAIIIGLACFVGAVYMVCEIIKTINGG